MVVVAEGVDEEAVAVAPGEEGDGSPLEEAVRAVLGMVEA